MIGLSGTAGQVLMNRVMASNDAFRTLGADGCVQGLQLDKAGRAASMHYIQVFLAFIFGMVLFHEPPHPVAVTGAVIIVCSAGAMAALKARRSRAASSTPSVRTTP